jgi:hypothetical protein
MSFEAGRSAMRLTDVCYATEDANSGIHEPPNRFKRNEHDKPGTRH